MPGPPDGPDDLAAMMRGDRGQTGPAGVHGERGPRGERGPATFTVLVIVSLLLLAVSVGLTAALFVVRTNDLNNIQTDIQTAHAQLRSTFCDFLLAYQVGEPSTPYGRALAARARDLAVGFDCPGAP